jgi:hypothetical protein
MALDLSVKPNFVSPSHLKGYCGEEESSSNSSDSCEEDTYSNNNNDNNSTMTALNLSLPKLLDYDDDDEDEEEEDDEQQDGKRGSQLSSQQLQLDIAALNLLCLARLQETAAVLAGRRPLPAHTSSSYPLVVSSSPLNRRTHRCDEPGCDKVNFCIEKHFFCSGRVSPSLYSP